MKTVMCFGTFDLLHPGHEFYLNKAKSLGDKLIVVVARDETVILVKGRAPRNDQTTRKKNLEEIGIADEVLIGRIEDKYSIIEEKHPDIIALGYDQVAFTEHLDEELNRRDISAEIVRIEDHKPHKYKSSLIRQVSSENQ